MSDEIKTAGLDEIKMNVSRGISYVDSYDNFIDIAAHIATKALVDKFKHGITATEDIKKEFDALKEEYMHFSEGYIGERKILKKAVQNSYKAKIELTHLANATSKDEVFKYALSALRCITDDDCIGEKWTNQ